MEHGRERQPIDPALRRFLDEQAAGGVRLTELTDEARVHLLRKLMGHALASRAMEIAGLPNSVAVRDVVMKPDLSGCVYLPSSGTGLKPVLVYLHGGGWVTGSVETLDPFCRLLSESAGIAIVSVEYRLAPEYPYPAALNDTLAAYAWVAKHSSEWGGNPDCLALGGDSAGGNLAAVAAHRLSATGQADALRALLLLYPVTDHPSAAHPSYSENATGYGLEAEGMRWFWSQYAPGIAPDDPEASPLRSATIPSLPPTLVATAEYDVLRDEGIAYAHKLADAGVRVTHLHAPDMHHNFPASPGTVSRFVQCDLTLSDIAGWLRQTFVCVS